MSVNARMTNARCNMFGRISSTVSTTRRSTLRRAKSLTSNSSLTMLVLNAKLMLPSTAHRDASNKIGSNCISSSAQGRRAPEIRYCSLMSSGLRLRLHSSRMVTTIAPLLQSKSGLSRCSLRSPKRTSISCRAKKQPLVKDLTEKFS